VQHEGVWYAEPASQFAFPISYCIAPGNYRKRCKNWLQSGTQDSEQQPANSFSTPIKSINMSHSALNGRSWVLLLKQTNTQRRQKPASALAVDEDVARQAVGNATPDMHTA